MRQGPTVPSLVLTSLPPLHLYTLAPLRIQDLGWALAGCSLPPSLSSADCTQRILFVIRTAGNNMPSLSLPAPTRDSTYRPGALGSTLTGPSSAVGPGGSPASCLGPLPSEAGPDLGGYRLDGDLSSTGSAGNAHPPDSLTEGSVADSTLGQLSLRKKGFFPCVERKICFPWSLTMHSGVLQDEGTGALSSRKHFKYLRAPRPFTPNSLSRSFSLSLSACFIF